MGLEPISVRKLEEQTEDIYEAVVVMSIRARQILRDRMVEAAMKGTGEEEFGVFDHVPDIDPEDYQELEKPTTIAVKEFLNGELTWHKVVEEEAE